MLIIGTHFFCWKVGLTQEAWRCGNCGTGTPFAIKKGMRFLTLFFVIPVLPLSRVKHLIECPSCSTRYEAKPDLAMA
jgi:hypothetical protein